MLCPAATAQSTNFLISWNSPTPKLSSVRSENTGTATPAPRQGRERNCGSMSATTTWLPAAGTSPKKWFGPSSQTRGRRVSVSTMTNLYSKASFTSRSSCQYGKRPSSRRWNSFQSPRAFPLPARATDSPVRTSGTATRKVTFPCTGPAGRGCRKEAPSWRRKITSLKA